MVFARFKAYSLALWPPSFLSSPLLVPSTYHISSLMSSWCWRVCRNHGSHFEKHKAAFEEGGGVDESEDKSAPVTEKEREDSLSDSAAEIAMTEKAWLLLSLSLVFF